jgi:hypothetical protein
MVADVPACNVPPTAVARLVDRDGGACSLTAVAGAREEQLVLRFIRFIHRDAPVLVFPWAFSPRT